MNDDRTQNIGVLCFNLRSKEIPNSDQNAQSTDQNVVNSNQEISISYQEVPNTDKKPQPQLVGLELGASLAHDRRDRLSCRSRGHCDGHRLRWQQISGQDAADQCVLLLDERMVVTIELDEAGERSLLYAPLEELAGEPPAAYAELLRANYLGGQSGGGMLGLQPDGEAIAPSQWVPTPGLDAARFSNALERFVNAADDWRQRLPRVGASATDDGADAPMQAIRG